MQGQLEEELFELKSKQPPTLYDLHLATMAIAPWQDHGVQDDSTRVGRSCRCYTCRTPPYSEDLRYIGQDSNRPLGAAHRRSYDNLIGADDLASNDL